MSKSIGYEEGDICNRDGCEGIIEEIYDDRSCYCHINPPCGVCTDPMFCCSECDWEGWD